MEENEGVRRMGRKRKREKGGEKIFDKKCNEKSEQTEEKKE
jgi:hypothetical protein